MHGVGRIVSFSHKHFSDFLKNRSNISFFLSPTDKTEMLYTHTIENFCGTYLYNLIKDPTCFKNPDKPSCIDLLLTNFSKSFLKSQTLETCLLDFYKLTLTVLQIRYKKQKPLVVTYRDYKNFSNESFRTEHFFC